LARYSVGDRAAQVRSGRRWEVPLRQLNLLSAGLLALVFLFAGIDKAFHFEGFVKALATYAVVPDAAARYVAVPILLSEIWVGAGLLIKPWRRMAAAAGAALLALFTAALTIHGGAAAESVCGCWFTVTLGTSTRLHVLQDLVLLALALSVWWDAPAIGRPPLRVQEKESS
jgi:uncharacterized membrane protein